ncbi:unnamed protein product [Merluccius merluccius]
MHGDVFFAVASVLLAIWVIPGGDRDPTRDPPPARLLSRDELSQYGGAGGSRGLYLAVVGQVFDVQRGERHYGLGGGYHGMAGKDASLAFVTGDFTESGLTDDVSTLTPSQAVTLYDWLAFYQKDYTPVGRLIGRFYNEKGQPTEALTKLEGLLSEGQRLKSQLQAESQQFPACNSEWRPTVGGRVWCSTKSGGVERRWAGVPRKLFSPGSSRFRCVCVEDPSSSEMPTMQEYQGCPPHSDSCTINE